MLLTLLFLIKDTEKCKNRARFERKKLKKLSFFFQNMPDYTQIDRFY